MNCGLSCHSSQQNAWGWALARLPAEAHPGRQQERLTSAWEGRRQSRVLALGWSYCGKRNSNGRSLSLSLALALSIPLFRSLTRSAFQINTQKPALSFDCDAEPRAPAGQAAEERHNRSGEAPGGSQHGARRCPVTTAGGNTSLVLCSVIQLYWETISKNLRGLPLADCRFSCQGDPQPV